MRLPDRSSSVWIDGDPGTLGKAVVPLQGSGLQAGLGVFETLALRTGRPLDLQAHLERLASGARVLSIELPAKARLTETVELAAAGSATPYGWLKILVLRGGPWYVFTGSMDAEEEGRAVSAIILPWRREPRDPLVGVKTTSYAAHQIGNELARRRGADEGLWLNSRGHLAEGCSSNLFVVRHRRLFTPSRREGILAGVVRALAIRAAKELGIAVHETRVRLKRLRQADEAFLTSSLSGVRPLIAVDGRRVGNGEPGPVTGRLASCLRSMRGSGADDATVSGTS
jgi:branched-subunit amino acid aminotransferase/4-amino-4-deoxychorismate lyase